MKKHFIWVWGLVICLVLGCTQPAWAEPVEAPVTGVEQAEQLDLGPIEAYLADLDAAASEVLGAGGIRELWQKAKAGEISFHPKEILQGIVNLFCKELLNNGRLLAQLALLAVGSALLCQLQSGFSAQGVSSLSRGVIYTALLGIALQSFISLGTSAYQAVDAMSGLLYALAPLLFTMLGAMGAVSTVALFHPAFLFLLGVGLNVIKTLVLPGVYCSAVFGVVSYISPKFNVKQLAKLCRDVSIGLMTIMLTLFTAALGIAGLASSAINGLTVKAAKTAAGLFVPVIGRTLADSFDTVLSTSLVLKNTIGLFGVIAIFLVCAAPAVKILVLSLLYRLTGALIEPLGDGELAKALTGLGNSLTALFAVVAASGLLFFFLLSIVIGMGNVTMMMR